MKAKFYLCHLLAHSIADSMIDAHCVDGGYHVRLSLDDEGNPTYTTSGGNRWTVTTSSPVAQLDYSGSRWGFKDGCNALRIELRDGKAFAVAGYSDAQGLVELVDWWSTLPGNPGPFEDWQAIMAAESGMAAYADLGESLEAPFHGWKLAA